MQGLDDQIVVTMTNLQGHSLFLYAHTWYI